MGVVMLSRTLKLPSVAIVRCGPFRRTWTHRDLILRPMFVPSRTKLFDFMTSFMTIVR
jgi:hypothetical protein